MFHILNHSHLQEKQDFFVTGQLHILIQLNFISGPQLLGFSHILSSYWQFRFLSKSLASVDHRS